MVIRASLRGWGGLVVPASLLASLAGCSDVAPADALRDGFPDHGDRVLHGDRAFARVGGGYVLTPGAGGWGEGRIVAEVPSDAAQPIGMRAGDLALEVREIGARGATLPAEDALSYAREDGRAYWVSAPGGIEEWLLIEGDHDDPQVPVAVWHVSGGALEQRGKAVDIVGHGGESGRIRVSAPRAYGPGGESLHLQLKVEGEHIELRVQASAGPMLVDPMWVDYTSMLTLRTEFDAALMPTGLVLVSGGFDPGVTAVTNDAELYDPLTATWSATNPMFNGRSAHTLTALDDGTVLAAGGWLAGCCELFGSETFDGTNWTIENDMYASRAYHTATKLTDGRVLACGGRGGAPETALSSGGGANAIGGSGTTGINDCEIFDPVGGGNGDWSQVSQMNQGRLYHRASLLATGEVMVSGGEDNGFTHDTASRYDVLADLWTDTLNMNVSRTGHTQTTLPNGNVLVTGGVDIFNAHNTGEIYDPNNDTWTPIVDTMAVGRVLHTATLLADGTVLIVGGFPDASFTNAHDTAEIFDPANNTFTATATMMDPRGFHPATRLLNDNVLVAGGYSTVGIIGSSEVYVSLLANGVPCTLGAQCTSNNCVDGVCCDTLCGNDCEACTTALKGGGNNGVCGPVSNGTDPDGNCTDAGAASCDFDGECNGSGACRVYAAGVICAPETCAGDDVVVADICNGSGTCIDNMTIDCGEYSCSNAICNTTCVAHPDCATTAYCDIVNGICLPKKNNGIPASDPVECLSGFVADTVCCDSVCDQGVCDACTIAAGATQNGTCESIVGDCDDDNDCTADACDPVSACFSASVLDGTACSGGVCVAGTCIPDAFSDTTASAGGSMGNGSGSGGDVGGDDNSGKGPVRLEGGGLCAGNLAGGRSTAPWWLIALIGAGAVRARRRR